MLELRLGNCYPKALVGVNVALAFVDGVIAFISFYQLMRIHARIPHTGWTRQKVFHLVIGSSNVGYFLYFVLTLVAACKGWLCWSHSCGFIVMACPKILFLAAFLLLLSFWVDLCHQANDEDEDEGCSPRETLLEKTNKQHLNANIHKRCCSFRIRVGSRQKVVIFVTLLIFLLMMASAVLIWIGMGRNPIDSSVVARVYVDLFAIAMLILGAALAGYGLVLFLKMRKIRSERASSEMWKVAGLAIVSVLCFTSSALVALFTQIPVLYHQQQYIDDALTSLLLVLYYFIGSSVPSAFVLMVMRELPPSIVINVREESRRIAFINDSSSVTEHPQRWTAIASSQNQVSRASPI